MPTVRETLRKAVADHLGVEIEKVTDEAEFRDDLGCDELDKVELVIEVEERFGIDIDDDEIELMVTFGDLVKLLDGPRAQVAGKDAA